MTIHDLLKSSTVREASDLHLKADSYPMMRVHGNLVIASEQSRLETADTASMADAIMDPEQHQRFTEAREIDLAYSVLGLGRFRCNIFQQRGAVGMVIRVIPTVVPPWTSSGCQPRSSRLPRRSAASCSSPAPREAARRRSPRWSIHISRSRPAHIMTIEDPIEYLHRDHRSVINQREASSDARSFAQALRAALRQVCCVQRLETSVA